MTFSSLTFQKPYEINTYVTQMNDLSKSISRSDDTQQITVYLPCRLAERAEKYAKENGNTVTGVVIEALDTFLRGQKLD